MPKVRFEQTEILKRTHQCEIDIPQEVIDQGEEDVLNHIRECEDMEYLEVMHEEISEDMIDVGKIKV